MEMYLSELIERAINCLSDLGLSPGTIDDYRWSAFRPIERRLGNPLITNTEVLLGQEGFFLEQYANGEISRHTRNWRIRGIHLLTEFFETGSFQWKVYSKREPISLPDKYTSILEQFMDTQKCCEKRKACKRSICQRFLYSLVELEIYDVSEIKADHIQCFIQDISGSRPKSMDDVITSLRGFFQFLCDVGMYDKSHWLLLAAPRCRDRRVRDGLSTIEIEKLLRAIPRDTPDGKRDFAAMAIAVFTGLRAGDIASLEFCDIDWKRYEIRIIQGKTSEPVIIPVEKSILNVLADYILNGRPETEDRHIFVRHCAPYCGYHDGVSIACIFRKYMKKAGIEHSIGDGKTLHGVRRGLGTGMAINGVSVELIAQVLGHTDTRATKFYISTDMGRLKDCALEFSSLGGETC